MRISDWSSDVCSSDLTRWRRPRQARLSAPRPDFPSTRHASDILSVGRPGFIVAGRAGALSGKAERALGCIGERGSRHVGNMRLFPALRLNRGILGKHIGGAVQPRSEEHTSELQSLMRISYAVFCLNKK